MKRLNFLLPLGLLALLMIVSHSCETIEPESCDTINIDECLADVEFCTSESESYYTYGGKTYQCTTADDCIDAQSDIYQDSECNYGTNFEDKYLQMKIRTQELIAEMRASL